MPSSMHVDFHEGNGPPVLLVHGIMAGRALWNANIEALRAVASPVVVELYGHGRSPSPIDPRAYQWDSYAAEFDRIRSGLGADRWFVIGQSLGAALTFRYVLGHPDRVIGHVVTNSVSALSSMVAATTELEVAAGRLEAMGHDGLLEHTLNPVRSRRIVDSVREVLAADQALLDARGIAMAMRHTVRDVSSREYVPRNRVPTLIVAGVKEKAFEEPCAHAETTMPNVTVERIESAGHSPNAETPQAFNDVVVRFLRQLRDSEPGR